MELDEIYGFLTTHEMILQCNDQEIAKKKKWVALRSNHKSNSKSESSSEDEDMDLLVQKFLKKKNRFGKKTLGKDLNKDSIIVLTIIN